MLPGSIVDFNFYTRYINLYTYIFIWLNVLRQDVAKIEATVIEKTLTHIDVHYWYMPRDRPSRKTKCECSIIKSIYE